MMASEHRLFRATRRVLPETIGKLGIQLIRELADGAGYLHGDRRNRLWLRRGS